VNYDINVSQKFYKIAGIKNLYRGLTCSIVKKYCHFDRKLQVAVPKRFMFYPFEKLPVQKNVISRFFLGNIKVFEQTSENFIEKPTIFYTEKKTFLHRSAIENKKFYYCAHYIKKYLCKCSGLINKDRKIKYEKIVQIKYILHFWLNAVIKL
jgi:hypothetical protein